MASATVKLAWDYRGVRVAPSGGDGQTYEATAAWLAELGCNEVQDWGCGTAWARKIFVQRGIRYVGLDIAPGFADEIVNLVNFVGQTDGIVMRHVLEHNYAWKDILRNALASCRHLALVIFTPFTRGEECRLAWNAREGVPDLSLNKTELTGILEQWKEKRLKTPTQYGEETIFFVGGERDAVL
jgi:SAM-dependent methyltransferase